VVHFWGDFNTLNAPAFFVDKIHHQPLKSFTVDRFRWMYDRSPGGPLPGEAPFLVAGVTAPSQPALPTLIIDSESHSGEHRDAPVIDLLPPPPLPDEGSPAEQPEPPTGKADGPTAFGTPADLAALSRSNASSANTPQAIESGTGGDSTPSPAIASRPKGSWLFGGSSVTR